MIGVLRWGQSAYETDADLAHEEAIAHQLGYGWKLHADRRTPPQERAEILVVTSQVRVDGAVLDHVQPSIVITTTSGYEHIDLSACVARGIEVARCAMARRDAVVEATLAHLVRLLRRFPDQEAPAARGEWARDTLPSLHPRSLAESTVVVVGLGVIGGEVAQHLRALGAAVRGVDPAIAGTWSLAEALPGADALTLHVASRPDNRGLVGAKQLDALPPHAVVVNTARGDILDVSAAVSRVRAGKLGGLACDVFPEEPWPYLRDAASNILFTPHASGYTRGLGRRVGRELQSAMLAYRQGHPVPGRIHPDAAGPRPAG
jgi:phosphoglycerate dehydrogenase-like enzyme